jgi:hypothetical protein
MAATECVCPLPGAVTPQMEGKEGASLIRATLDGIRGLEQMAGLRPVYEHIVHRANLEADALARKGAERFVEDSTEAGRRLVSFGTRVVDRYLLPASRPAPPSTPAEVDTDK